MILRELEIQCLANLILRRTCMVEVSGGVNEYFGICYLELSESVDY